MYAATLSTIHSSLKAVLQLLSVACPVLHLCTKLGAMFICTEILAFYEIQYGRHSPCWICWGVVVVLHPRMPIRGGYPPVKTS